MYSIAMTDNNSDYMLEGAKRLDLKCAHHKKKKQLYDMMEVS